MVFINDKKYACDKCIKGHRVSGCTHTDRPLFEVKKKGRPTTQCQHCKEKRKSSGSSVHTKCACGDLKAPAPLVIHPPSDTTEPVPSQPESVPAGSDVTSNDIAEEVETRKGQPGSKATFPNGLKDVHEIAAAAGALAGLGDEGVIKVAERNVQALLNPCKCQTGGPCKCCHPKKEKEPSPRNSPPLSTTVAPASSAAGTCCSPSTAVPLASLKSTLSHLAPPNPLLSPGNLHHPAHTSPHVHKTKLYSPYSMDSSRSGRRDVSNGSRSGQTTPRGVRPPPPRIKPITDVGTLIGAAVRADGSFADEIMRSAVGLPKLPGIQTFDTMAENGGVKVEPMEMEDVDMPLAFPTAEDVVIGACMCGVDCPCPDCATHNNRSGSQTPTHPHGSGMGCGEGCKSSHHHCGQSVSLPSGLASVSQLIAAAAFNVPRPPESNRYGSIDPHDTRILPPAADFSEDAARTLGYVQIKPLECCNGRCQCAPGECVCAKECCGCCVRCACAEEDGDTRMDETGDDHSAQSTAAPASCCSGTSSALPNPTPIQITPDPSTAPSLLAAHPTHSPVYPPAPSSSSSRHSSPHGSGTTTPVTTQPPSSLRRAASSSSRFANQHAMHGSSGRRATVTGQPPAVANTKAASKAASGQPRPILPRPPVQNGQPALSIQSSSSSRQQSPIGKNVNSAPGRTGSPGIARRVNRTTSLPTSSAVAGPSRSSDNHQADPPSMSLSNENHQPADTAISSIAPHQAQIAVSSMPPVPTYPLVMTSEPQDSDLIDPSITVDPLMLEFFNSLVANDPSQSLAYGESSFLPQPQQEQTSMTFGTNAPPAFDPDFDIERFLAEALGDQGGNQPFVNDYPAQLKEAVQGPADAQYPQQSQPNIDILLADFLADSTANFSSATTPGQPVSASLDAQSVPPHAELGDPPAQSSGSMLSFPGIVPGLPEPSWSPMWTNRAQAASLPAHTQTEHIETASANKGNGQSIPEQHVQSQRHQSDLEHVSHTISADSTHNPDIIDLSKPLDAKALARIMQALQQQQHNQEQAYMQPQPQPQAQPPPQAQFYHQSLPHTKPQSQQSTYLPSHSQAANVYPPVEAQMMQQQQQQQALPTSHDHLASGPESISGGSGNIDLDDMFSQFVTLEGAAGKSSTSTFASASASASAQPPTQDPQYGMPEELTGGRADSSQPDVQAVDGEPVHMRTGQDWILAALGGRLGRWDQSMSQAG